MLNVMVFVLEQKNPWHDVRLNKNCHIFTYSNYLPPSVSAVGSAPAANNLAATL